VKAPLLFADCKTRKPNKCVFKWCWNCSGLTVGWRQWILNCVTSSNKGTSVVSAAMNSWYSHSWWRATDHRWRQILVHRDMALHDSERPGIY